MQKTFYKLIDEICAEKNIKQKMLSYGLIRELERDNIVHHILHYQFDLNPANAYVIAGDKFATYSVLKNNNIPTIEHFMLFNPNTRKEYFDNEYEKVIREMFNNHKRIVIKANDSCEGKYVYSSENLEHTNKIIKEIFAEGKDNLSICPFMNINYEYRVIVLCGEILFIYKKKKPFVVGDGKTTLKNLIDEKEDVKIDFLEELKLDSIPKEKEEVTISWKHNLSNGAVPMLLDEDDFEHIEKIKDIALLATKAININFASVDIARTDKNELFVVEVNGSVCMNKFSEKVPNGYQIAKNIYSKAIDKMFEN